MSRQTTSADSEPVADAAVPVALVFSFSLAYCRQVLLGIRKYAKDRDWLLYPIVPQPGLGLILEQLRPAGIITHAFHREIAEGLLGIREPVVNVSRADPGLPFPQVNIEEQSIGALAAEHLMDCGLRHFGYLGPSRYGTDSGREGGFYRALDRIPHTIATCHTQTSPFDPADTRSFSREDAREWVRRLPKPAGVFTPDDAWGLWISDVCRQEGVRVPDEVAIIGVNNDELLCELAQPPLSSVAIPAERVGYEAAAMLEGLMAGGAPPQQPVLLPPLGVIARQSSDTLAVDNPDLAAATRYIRQHACEDISVRDILNHVMISRRSLERLFRSVLGHSPSEEIRRLRVNKAKSLLVNSELQMPEIARRSGFSSAKQHSTVFNQVTAVTPTAYRRQAEADTGDSGRQFGSHRKSSVRVRKRT